MIRPRDVYRITQQDALSRVAAKGFRIVGFHVPKQSEWFLDIFGAIHIDRDEDPTLGMVGPAYERLILEQVGNG